MVPGGGARCCRAGSASGVRCERPKRAHSGCQFASGAFRGGPGHSGHQPPLRAAGRCCQRGAGGLRMQQQHRQLPPPPPQNFTVLFVFKSLGGAGGVSAKNVGFIPQDKDLLAETKFFFAVSFRNQSCSHPSEGVCAPAAQGSGAQHPLTGGGSTGVGAERARLLLEVSLGCSH